MPFAPSLAWRVCARVCARLRLISVYPGEVCSAPEVLGVDAHTLNTIKLVKNIHTEAFSAAIRAATRRRREAKTRFLTRLRKYVETVKLRNRCGRLGTSQRALFLLLLAGTG